MPMRPTPITSDLAMVLGGGGARGAYQVGLLRGIARRYPHLKIPILVGVSAGAVNTTHLAAHRGTFEQAMEDLAKQWLSMTPDRVFRVDASSLASNVLRTGFRLVAGGSAHPDQFRGMVDTAPLRTFLEGVLEQAPDGSLPGIEPVREVLVPDGLDVWRTRRTARDVEVILMGNGIAQFDHDAVTLGREGAHNSVEHGLRWLVRMVRCFHPVEFHIHGSIADGIEHESLRVHAQAGLSLSQTGPAQ